MKWLTKYTENNYDTTMIAFEKAIAEIERGDHESEVGGDGGD